MGLPILETVGMMADYEGEIMDAHQKYAKTLKRPAHG